MFFTSLTRHSKYVLFALVALLCFHSRGYSDVVDGFESRIFNGLPYRLFIPDGYVPTESYRLVLFLHGAGGRGSDNLAQISGGNFAGSHLWTKPEHQAVYPCFVVAPQCPSGNQWVDWPWSQGSYSIDSVPVSNEMQTVLGILNALKSEFNIDEVRMYVTGQSMGGYGTWDIILRNPALFAAAIPVCGGGDPSKTSLIKEMGIWAFHGALDPTVPVSGSRDMIHALETVGGEPNYTEYPDMLHGIWNNAYSTEGLVDWMFSFSNTVDLADFVSLSYWWTIPCGTNTDCLAADWSGDGMVNIYDLEILAQKWLK